MTEKPSMVFTCVSPKLDDLDEKLFPGSPRGHSSYVALEEDGGETCESVVGSHSGRRSSEYYYKC
jgi:hypothetical protein